MRILMLCPEYSIHSVKWINALADRGYEVHSCYCKGQEDKASLINNKVIRHMLPIKAPYGYYINAPFLKGIVKSINPDIIHVHRASSYATLARFSGVRCDILSIWGSDVYEFPIKKNANRRIIEKNLDYAKCLASTSAVMAEQSKLFLLDKSKKINVTPFGVNVDLFKPCHINHNNIVIGTVKTLSIKYGIDIAIKAFGKTVNKLKSRGYDQIAESIKYNIYGRGPLKDKLQELINDLQLEDKIKLCGYIQNNDVPNVINSFDIFLLASNEESFGVAAVEAMACGIPIVATKVPGFSEVIDNGNTGLLVDIDDVENMSESLYRLIIDIELRKKLGNAGRERVLQKYNWDDNVSQMEKLYKEVNNV